MKSKKYKIKQVAIRNSRSQSFEISKHFSFINRRYGSFYKGILFLSTKSWIRGNLITVMGLK
jgi:hypothetical protein